MPRRHVPRARGRVDPEKNRGGRSRPVSVAGTSSLIPEQARSAVKLSRKKRMRLGLAEYVIARILELPAQVVEVDIQQPALPLAHLSCVDLRLDVGPIYDLQHSPR